MPGFDDESGPVLVGASSNTLVEEFCCRGVFQGCLGEMLLVLSWAQAEGIELSAVLNKRGEYVVESHVAEILSLGQTGC